MSQGKPTFSSRLIIPTSGSLRNPSILPPFELSQVECLLPAITTTYLLHHSEMSEED